MPESEPPQSVAIVGLGPKGLYCLERLLAELHHRPPKGPVALHLWEPRAKLGVSPPYDLDQPPYLRMNFANRWVDARPPQGARRPAPSPGSEWPALVPWLEEHVPELSDPEDYAPRSVVGEYLHTVFEAAVAELPKRVRIVRHAETAVRVERAVGEGRPRWRVVGTSGEQVLADEVLLSVGHDARPRPPLEGVDSGLIPAVFPVNRYLDEDAVPPGSDVAVRGFALTWIDATLALFEGRGGRFEPVGGGPGLRYRPATAEVRTVLPFSRTGRPLLAKPDGHRVLDRSDLEEVWNDGQEQLAALPFAGESSTASLLRLVVASAARAWRQAEPGQGKIPNDAEQALIRLVQARCAEPPSPLEPEAVVQEMRRGWEVAVGARPLDALWALGRAWRGLYPALVERIGHGGLPTAAWPSFWRLAREMERIAFGPPAVNVAKILALVDAGRIDLSFVQNPTVSFSDGSPQLVLGDRRRTVDRLVHAVLRAPGAEPGQDSLLGRLLDAGHARQLAGTSGIEITPSGQCVGDDGRPTPGLSVIGRATEGCVLGNDTLSRTLHRHPERWAARVVARLVKEIAAT